MLDAIIAVAAAVEAEMKAEAEAVQRIEIKDPGEVTTARPTEIVPTKVETATLPVLTINQPHHSQI